MKPGFRNLRRAPRWIAAGLLAAAGMTGAQQALAQDVVTLDRDVFRPGYYEETKSGKALRANAVNSSVGADIAFAALNDTLAMGVTAASGGTVGADPVSGFIVGEAIDAVTGAFRDKDAQLPRLAKFSSAAATYLEYDNGDWCIIQDGNSLAILEDDALEPMIRSDIPANAGAQLCRYPDGFYKHQANATVYFLYSLNASSPSWYGIGFGESYCGIPSEAMWQELAKVAHPDVSEYNVRQPTLFRPADINKALAGRTNRGTCTGAESQNRQAAFRTPPASRSILYPDHYDTSGHGAALRVRAETGNPLGDLMTSKMAGFIAGVYDVPFYGTVSTALSAFTANDTTLPRMAKRSNSNAVYLQYDDGSWCFMAEAEMLSQMKGDSIEVEVTGAIPGNVQPSAVKACGWPDGFFKTFNNDQVYYLFSTSTANPAWYGMGFGDAYCRITDEGTWRKLIGYAGGNGARPQESLIRISDTKFLAARREVSCPGTVVRGVAQNVAGSSGPVVCATENQMCSFSGTRTVTYGAPGRTVTKSLAGPITCSNAVFGTDPAPGVVKSCSVQ
ncbi:MAG: hypothetical protein WDN24_12440 [Sphingomonas sp.]